MPCFHLHYAFRLNSGVRSALNTIVYGQHRALHLALALVIGLMFSWASGIEFYQWHVLSGPTVETQASVTATRRNPSRKAFVGPPYQLQYEFQVGSSIYHYTGQWLVVKRWVRVPEETLVSAQTIKTLSVRYAASDPRINQPSSLPVPTMVDAIGFLILAAVSFLSLVVFKRDRGGKSNNSFNPKRLRRSG